MQIIYVVDAGLDFTIENEKVVAIEKHFSKNVHPNAIRVDRLDVTTERTVVDGARLQLDAWALTDFAAWLFGQMPNAKSKQFCNRFLGYFPGSRDIMDVLRGTINVVAPESFKRLPQGDERHYMEKARASDRDAFEELASAWLEMGKSKAQR